MKIVSETLKATEAEIHAAEHLECDATFELRIQRGVYVRPLDGQPLTPEAVRAVVADLFTGSDEYPLPESEGIIEHEGHRWWWHAQAEDSDDEVELAGDISVMRIGGS